ncbi:MAG TPA: TetR/AcrR family transcriptional regulator [Thermoanaerobaculia bacterium]|nr:TetR/AcrR family transcriptional regulator [Thermoanaerobaculia bacterium]
MRTRILDAARELFAEQGYDAVTMRKIAERIEYSPTAIYFHFRDKQTLLRELCDADFGALAQDFQKIARLGDPIDRLRQIGRAYVEFAIAYPSHYRLMFMTPKPAGLRAADSRITRGNPEEDAYAFLRATLEEAIAAGMLRPDLQDADLVSQMVWAGVHGVVSLQIAKKEDDWVDWHDPRETAHELIDVMIRGIVRERN